ncbi:MAG: Na+:solute symporter [Deltaproteobacteria bacterium]|nr:Na+:solute symporter [Deltaproteobacteria bacterium]MDQ3297889.1 Na+:solute symporter [Myxococcota bacterium]
MSLLDVAIILAFIAYAVISGLRSREVAGKNLEEYFLAGRTLPGWKAGCSMAATQFAADTPLMVTGLIATAGVFSLWRMWIYAIAFLVLGFILAPSWRRASVITDAELTELRYGGKAAAVLRGVKAVYFGTIFNCAVLSFVLLAATRIAEPFMTWDQWGWFPDVIHGAFVSFAEWMGTPITLVGDDPATWPADVWIRSANNILSILSILLVTTFYSTTGGLRSVVDTDVVQLGIMLVGTFLFMWFVVDKVGGLGEVPDQIRARFADGGPGGIKPDEILAITPGMAKDVGLAVLAVFAIQWLAQMNADGTGYLAQRSMACRSERDAQQASVWFVVIQILVRSLMWVPLGLGLLLMFPPDLSLSLEHARADREFTYVRAMAELPVGLKGLLVTAMLAALASTVDTHLNWGSSYWTNDIYKRFICQSWRKKEPSDRSLVWVARGANFLILGISLVVMTQLGSIASAWKTSLLLGAGMGGVLLLRWLWWRLTAWGELSAIIASAVLAPILLATIDADTSEGEAIRLLVMFAVSTATGIVVSLTARKESMEHLVVFYKRARPPGAWGPVALAAGADPAADLRRLWLGAGTVVVAAISLFSILTAAAALLADSPPPSWLPRTVWLIALIVLGVGLIPVWRRLAARLNVSSVVK